MDNDIEIIAKIKILQDFTEETRKRIAEFKDYESLGILGLSMRNDMLMDISARIAITEVEMNKLFEAMEC